jgi:hypothetical protein
MIVACCFFQNEFVLSKLYILVNLCEMILNDESIRRAIDHVCYERIDLNED